MIPRRQISLSVAFIALNVLAMGVSKGETIVIDDFTVGHVGAGEQVWSGGGISGRPLIQFEQTELDTDHVHAGNRKVTFGTTNPPEEGMAFVSIGGEQNVLEFSSTVPVEGIELRYRFEPPLDLSHPDTTIFAEYTGDFKFGVGTGGAGFGFLNEQFDARTVSASDMHVSSQDLSAVTDLRFLFAFGTQMQLSELRIVVPEPSTSVLLFFGVCFIALIRWTSV
ncbi:hypothetical protein ACFL2H_05750 [Planctomycetota bacterium]